MSEVIYLAVPYSHELPEVRHDRARLATAAMVHLMRQGHIVYSPITHTHAAAIDHGLPTDYEYWRSHCEMFVTMCSRVVVLAIDGHDRSVGVAAEITLARQQGKPVEWMRGF